MLKQTTFMHGVKDVVIGRKIRPAGQDCDLMRIAVETEDGGMVEITLFFDALVKRVEA